MLWCTFGSAKLPTTVLNPHSTVSAAEHVRSDHQLEYSAQTIKARSLLVAAPARDQP